MEMNEIGQNLFAILNQFGFDRREELINFGYFQERDNFNKKEKRRILNYYRTCRGLSSDLMNSDSQILMTPKKGGILEIKIVNEKIRYHRVSTLPIEVKPNFEKLLKDRENKQILRKKRNDFIMERLNYAIEIIEEEPSLPLKYVAKKAGFKDYHQFLDATRKRFSYTPKILKNELLEKEG